MAEARNAAENAVYTAEKALRDVGDKLPADIRSKVETRIQATRGALESDERPARPDGDQRAAAGDAGDRHRRPVSRLRAPRPVPRPARRPATGAASPADDVIDGEFKET